MGAHTQGRRRDDLPEGDLPSELAVGDYWKVLDAAGAPKQSAYESNLTGTCWRLAVPMATDDGYALANLMAHTVREHEDGSISVVPGDGSSNSILVTSRWGGRTLTWHGFVYRGVLEECE